MLQSMTNVFFSLFSCGFILSNTSTMIVTLIFLYHSLTGASIHVSNNGTDVIDCGPSDKPFVFFFVFHHFYFLSCKSIFYVVSNLATENLTVLLENGSFFEQSMEIGEKAFSFDRSDDLQNPEIGINDTSDKTFLFHVTTGDLLFSNV
jgi:hypothetical protein